MKNEITKAKAGDLIKSLHVPGLESRGWLGGKVLKVEVDERDGVEYIYCSKDFDARPDDKGLVVTQLNGLETFRTPQNGTQSWTGEVFNHVSIVKEA